MHRRWQGVLLAALVTAPMVSAGRVEAAETLGGWHEDPRYGWKMRVPRDWSAVPQRVEEKWIVAKFLGDRGYTDGKQEWAVNHRPNLTVVVISDAARARRGAKVTKTDEGFSIDLTTPFKDYRDYLKRNYSEGGWYFSREETGKAAGVDVEFLEAKIEKLVDAPRRIVTWVFRQEDADFAVQFEVLEAHAAKLVPFVESSLKTFQFVPRTKPAPSADTTGGQKIEIDTDSDPAAKRRRKAEAHERFVEKAVSSLPAGWTVKRLPHAVILSHVDDKYATRIGDQAKAVLAWIEETFSWLEGPEPRIPVIRICKDSEEERAFTQGSTDAWSFDSPEIVTHKDTGSGKQGFEFQWLNSRLLSHWMGDRAPDLATSLPPWFERGLSEYVATAVVKAGGRLEFRPDDWGREKVREALRKDKARSFRSLVTDAWDMGSDDGEGYSARLAQSAFAIRWLREGPGAKGRTKDLIRRYLTALKEVVADIEAKEKAEGSGSVEKEAETEEEEEEQMRKRRTKWKDEEAKLRQAVHDKVFAGWTDKDWREVDASYLAFIK
jgi:hypothetical protein